MDAVAFATSEEVLYLTLRAASRSDHPQPPIVCPLDSIFSKTCVGFSMARTILHLHREHDWHIDGVEASTVCVSPQDRPWSAAKFLYEKVHKSVRMNDVLALWYPDKKNKALERTCRRAWVSAVYVMEFFFVS